MVMVCICYGYHGDDFRCCGYHGAGFHSTAVIAMVTVVMVSIAVPWVICRSAGASLRRYNEAALMTEMRDLMTSWSAYAAEASCVFIRIPRHSRRILVGDKGDRAPFLRGDPRVRDLPFATRRPTLKEAKAVHARLATIYVGVVRSGETRPPAGRPREERLSKNGGGGRGEKRCVTDDLNADVTDVINVTDLSSVPSIPDPDLPGVDSADSQMEESKIRRKKKGKNKPDAVSSGNKGVLL